MAPRPRRHLASAACVIGIATAVTAPAASAKELCVGGGGCFATIQDAADAAKAGDTIRLKPGTHRGGATIDVSMTLAGAGADRTVIRGGGPVLTIGTFGATHQPTVSISDVTITGGVTRSSPMSEEFTGEDGVFAVGGGIEVLPTKDFNGGGTLTISDSVIAANRVIPRRTVPGGADCPGEEACPFAFAGGGGIDTWGDLKLVRTNVRGNRVGAAAGTSGPTSDADGGGIASRGALVLIRSRVVENRATAHAPTGRFAEGGGIYAPSGTITIRHSSVSRNRAVLRTSFPSSVDLLAIGGGMQLADGITAVRIDDSRMARNRAKGTNAAGHIAANSGAFNLSTVDARFRMVDSALVHNRIRSVARGGHGDAFVDSGAGTLASGVVRTLIADNSAMARSRHGDATASGGGALMFGRVADSEIVDNTVAARAPRGRAQAGGGGLEVDLIELALTNTLVARNSASAVGERGFARGGGIFNARLFAAGADMTLVDSTVVDNAVLGSGELQGGGVFADDRAVQVVASAISGNAPDQCFGC